MNGVVLGAAAQLNSAARRVAQSYDWRVTCNRSARS
jgi:hypothetical protein